MAPHQTQSFGERLRRFREAAGLTQEQLAERAGLTAKGIGALERGERRHPQAHTVKALVRALKLHEQERAELLAAIPKRLPSQVPAQGGTPEAEPGLGAGSALLLTKLHRPRVTESVVERPRLHVPFRMGVARSLTLVAAPAGYGKTTLVAQQLALLPQPSAWLSLDAGDNDPATFARYLVTAVQSITASVSASTRSLVRAATPHLEPVLVSLINDLAALPHDLVVVLDDYHLLTNPEVHTAMAFLLDHLPPLLHVVIVTREDPPFPLAKLRARRQLVEIRAVDLRFTPKETADFLYEQVGLALRAEDVARLGERTEGWIAGLHLAALALQQHGAAGVSAFVAAFSGSNRFVIDYLVDEVIAQLPAHTRTFLLSTSILERLCGPLCDAVLGLAADGTPMGSSDGSYSQDILVDLERRHLFLIPLDDERRWYRYHHLFAQVLGERLVAGMKENTVATLHRRASTWFEAQGFVVEAVQHALAAHDWERGVRLLEAHGRVLMARGHVHAVLGWLRGLPETLVSTRPYLLLLEAIGLFSLNQLETPELRVEEAERILSVDPLDDRSRAFLFTAVLLRALIARFRGDWRSCATLSRQAQEIVPATDVSGRVSASVNVAAACLLMGDVRRANERQLVATVTTARQLGDLFPLFYGTVTLAGFHQRQGRLQQAAATYREAADVTPESETLRAMPNGATYYFGLGSLLREWNDLDAAEDLLVQGRELIRGRLLVDADAIAAGYIALARLQHARGARSAALATLHEFSTLAGEQSFASHLLARGAAARAHLVLLQGDLPTAAQWADTSGVSADDDFSYPREQEHLALARIRIAQARRDPKGGVLDVVLQLLERCLKAAEAGARIDSVIEIVILRALALQARSEFIAALATLEHALTLAAPEGYVRIFVDEGAPMATLLVHTLPKGAWGRGDSKHNQDIAAYVQQLLGVFHAEGIGPQVDAPRPRSRCQASTPDVELLTAREIEVLRLLASGASNQAIADHLVISLPTAKKHVANILGKLQVHNRTEAIARALALHLL